MRNRDVPSWWERLGGPNAISVPAWLLTLPGGVAASFSWLPRGVHVQVLTVVGLSVFSHVLTGAVLYPAWLTYLSPRPRASRPWALVATLLLAGAVRGAFLAHTTAALGLVATAPVFARTIGTAVAVLVWFSLATLIVDSSRRHRDVMAGLRREVERERTLADESARLVREFRVDQVAQIEAIVIGQLEAASVGPDPLRTASRLRQTARDVVRPLSHDLEQRSVMDAELLSEVGSLATKPRPPLRDYLVGMVTERPFAPLVTAVVFVATPLAVTLTVLGPVLGTVMLAVAGLTLFTVLAVARRGVAPALPWLRVPFRIVAVLSVWALATALTGLVAVWGIVAAAAEPDSWLASIGFDVVQSTLAVSIAMASITMLAAAAEGAVEGQRRRAEDDLRDAALATEWARARLRQRMWVEQRRLARVLHGEVQARLVATAHRLAAGHVSEGAGAVATLSEDVRAALTDEGTRGWRIAMDDIATVWALAVDLDVDVDALATEALDRDQIAAQAVLAVVAEAVTNAVRHGDAGRVTIGVRGRSNYIEVTVVDDGRAASGTGSGLGRRMFDAACLQWSLTRGPATTLRALVACQPAAAHGFEEAG